MPAESLPLQLRVERSFAEAEGVCSFELVADDATELPAFKAGAHIDVLTPGGLIRQYSLMNPGTTSRYRIGVLHDPKSRGGSASIHESVGVGTVLSAGYPRNHFELDQTAQFTLLLAGGIGITPVMAMAEELHARSADFLLHYSARSAGRMAFRDELLSRPWADRIHFHLDDGPIEKRLQLTRCIDQFAAGSHLYACGPGGFLAAIKSTAQLADWPDDHIHFEHFVNNKVVDSPTRMDSAFEVQIASTGQVIIVNQGVSVTAALAACGIELPVSCEQGICGTCLTPVIDGIPDHRDLYLNDLEHEQNQMFTPCCSRAFSSRLVLGI